MSLLKQEINAQSADFSFDNIKDFDTHIELSIPNYSELKEYLVKISSYFIKGGNVVDLGCSTGQLIGRLSKEFQANYIGVDTSENLLGKYCELSENIQFKRELLQDFEIPKSDLIFSIYTIQFLPLADRLPLLIKVFNSVKPEGAFIFCEKIFYEDSKVNELITFCYYDFKRLRFTAEEIFKKQYDLRKIMNPLTEQQNISLLNAAGFTKVYSLWQSLQFKAWLCLK